MRNLLSWLLMRCWLARLVSPRVLMILRGDQKCLITPAYCVLLQSMQVKSQGYCASSWAFSAAGAVEGQFFKKKGKGESLSEQQLIDCSWSYGNAGCNGGHMIYSFRYIQDNDGICSESAYPYLGYVSSAKYCTYILTWSQNKHTYT